MSYVDSLLSATSGSSASSTTSSSTSGLGMDAFLQLLVTQLQYQDPLDPMDDKEFVAELAQFSSLEQLTEINSGIEGLSTLTQEQQMIGAVNFIGKTIDAAVKRSNSRSSMPTNAGSSPTAPSSRVAAPIGLGAQAGAGEVGRSGVAEGAVDDHHLPVAARADLQFQPAVNQSGQ